MNKYVKQYLHRGLAFGGFGPIILGIVYAILEATLVDFSLGGWQVLVAILSTYVIAFVQAGSSVFNQIEEWSLSKSFLFHLSSIYLVYLFAYLVNSWIPFDIIFVLVFTGVFLVTYLAVWITVAVSVRIATKKLNDKMAAKESDGE